LGEAVALHSKAQLWHSIAIRSNGKAKRRRAVACDEKRSTGKAKMDNVMAERSGVERRQSKDLESIGKAMNCVVVAKQ